MRVADRNSLPAGEQRSLRPAEDQLPLSGAYTSSTVTPTAALAIGDRVGRRRDHRP